MANNAITNNKLTDDLVLTGKPVLVQNSLGIFYGFLEKSDSRSATALLRDGFMLSPDNHITFSQYLDFFSSEVDEIIGDMDKRFGDSLGDHGDETDDTVDILDESIIPNEILIDQKTLDEHKRKLTITDYASEGIFLVQRRTSTYENSKYIQAFSPLISLTNVIAIVAISETTVAHAGLRDIIEDIEKTSYPFVDDSIYYYNDLTPMITFGLLNKDMQLLIYLALHEKDQDINIKKLDKYVQEVPDLELTITQSSKYIYESISRSVSSYRTNKDDKSDKFKEDIAPLIKALVDLPSLIVNSEKRVERYKELEKAQSNEQNK